ncbi:MAG: SUMF1/EgtB/PvdO family nonheme iron enzyme, partial [Deltaproteobacteria bacterium]|nr:SUMF1/EgtB/PvdO family nonheme iron enzyme [Deltaproteobacteria bacterium]
ADDGTLPGVGAACYTKGLGCTFSGGNWTCVGVCATGLQACSNGTLVCAGDIGPAPEVCDGLDNDCNGQTDEGLPPRPCYPDATPGCNVATSTCVGLCRLGTSTCGGVSGWGACTGAVTPVPEVCDGKDNDCNGTPDDGSMAGVGDTCYGAASGCTLSGGVWTCIGECRTGTKQCVTGNLACVGYQGPVPEVCDVAGQDSDCDGFPSNGFNLLTDLYNCGACGNDCTTLQQSTNAWPYCEGGVCKRTCKADYWDVDGNYGNGCEYHCVNTGAEVCDGIDNDCNGQTDDSPVSPGNFCRQLGACAGASPSCGTYTPTAPPESGDDLNQLAGWSMVGATDVNTDDGILYVTLADNSGTRTVSLYRDPALTELVAAGSRTGDGAITLAEQSSSGLSGQVTVTFVADDSSITIAVPIKAWICNYNPVTVDVVGLNRIAPQESKCDNIDNNCDGSTDERFFVDHIKGSACQQDGVYGQCRGYGLWACNGTGTAAVCDLTCGPPSCKLETAPTAETCDNMDNDCDGVVDNGVADAEVHVTAGGLDFYVFTYEASRPGATATNAGTADHRACSQAGVLPWTFVSYADAADACAASGARLCTGPEWGAACVRSPAFAYPYGGSYAPLTCNGEDYDGVPGGSDDDVLIPTGQAAACTRPAPDPAIYDLSGNAKEWTSQYTGTTPAPENTPIAVVRGGAYDTPAIGLRCDFTLSRAAVDVLLPTLGFRCCSPCAPGLHFCPSATVCPVPACAAPSFCDTATDFSGVRHCARCVDALNDEANCGGCGVTCSVGKTCVNGTCR